MIAKFSLGFNLSGPAALYADYAQMAEQYGFDGPLFVGDSQCIWRDPYVSLALIAVKTKRILIGTGVTNPITRHPTVTACALSTLNELSGGRIVLGIGAGDTAVLSIGKRPIALRDLAERVDMIRQLLAGETVNFDRKEIKIAFSRTRIPVFVAATGMMGLRVAGQIADGVIVNVGAEPRIIRAAISSVKEGIASANRREQDVEIWVRIMCSVDEQRDAALSEGRSYAVNIANSLLKYGASYRNLIPSDLSSQMDKVRERYDIYKHTDPKAAHSLLATPLMVDTFVVAGTAQECVEKLSNLVGQTGVTRFTLPAYFTNIPAFIRIFSEKVIPFFR